MWFTITLPTFVVYYKIEPFIKDFFTWNFFLMLLEIIYCCVVMFAIMWSMKHLKKTFCTASKTAKHGIQ
jgi:hypothetical protein